MDSKKRKADTSAVSASTVDTASMASEELQRLSSEKKAIGNEAFKGKQYQEALACYSEAIVMYPQNPDNHILYANRSACHGALSSWKEAVEDANECLRLNSSYTKGYFRLASAQLALQQTKEAEETARKGLCYDSANTGLGQLVRKCRRLQKELKEEARVQRERTKMAEKAAGMTAEERKWKAWCATRGHGQVVNNKNLDKFIPDAAKNEESLPRSSFLAEGQQLVKDEPPQDPQPELTSDEKMNLVLSAAGLGEYAAEISEGQWQADIRALLSLLRTGSYTALDNCLAQLSPSMTTAHRGTLLSVFRRLADDCTCRYLDLSWDLLPPEVFFPTGPGFGRTTPSMGLGAFIQEDAESELSTRRRHVAFSWRQRVGQVELRVPLPAGVRARDLEVLLQPERIHISCTASASSTASSGSSASSSAGGGGGGVSRRAGDVFGLQEREASAEQEREEEQQQAETNTFELLDFQLRKKILVDGSTWMLQPVEVSAAQWQKQRQADSDSFFLHQDDCLGLVLVLQLKKWHSRSSGNCTDASQTWWRTVFIDANEEECDLQHPPTDYYSLKDE